MQLNYKGIEDKLKDYFKDRQDLAVAFSGGTDSALLLKLAMMHCRRVKAYYVRTQFQPERELNEAKELAKSLGADLKVIEEDILSHEKIVSNPSDRCYHCKRTIMGLITEASGEDGFELTADGSNFSDDPEERPGMKALLEFGIISPLRDLKLSKKDVRHISKELGLPTFSKPSYSCLATRTPNGNRITCDILERTEKCEEFLISLGFSDFRVRNENEGKTSRIEVKEEELQRVIRMRNEILKFFGNYFERTVLDLKGR